MFDALIAALKPHRFTFCVIVAAITILDVALISHILAVRRADDALTVSFLAVGQGDSTLIRLPHGVKALIDGGPPNGAALEGISETLSPFDRTIDLVVISHPQLDHFGGLIEVVKQYRVGGVLVNGRAGTSEAFRELDRAIKERSLPLITLRAGDVIRVGESRFKTLSPTEELAASDELNDTSLVLELESKGARFLFTGDIGKRAEQELVRGGIHDIHVLKVPHHGSRFSSTAPFLAATGPEAAVIEVGKNSYGHPTDAVLDRLSGAGARVYRTDKDGTVTAIADGKSIKIFRKK